MTADEVLVAVLAALPPTILAAAAYRSARKVAPKIDELHIAVNSRLTQLLATTAASSHAEGELIGRADAAADTTSSTPPTGPVNPTGQPGPEGTPGSCLAPGGSHVPDHPE